MIKITTLLSFTFLLSSFSLFAQTPCTAGFAGVYPCNGIDLKAYVSLSASQLNATGTNDIWGWTGSNGKEYALVGLTNGTSFVDISNPSNPVIIGKLPTHSSNSTWRSLKVIGNYAYIGSEATGHGIQIFNLTRLITATNYPVTFTEDNWISIGNSNRSHSIAANEHTQYIIPTGTYNLNGGGLTFYNVSNPLIPQLDGSYASDGYSHDAVCITYRGPDVEHIGKEICIGFNEDNLAILNVTNKSNPVFIKSFTYTGINYCHQGWITADHKYLVVNDEFDELNLPSNTRTYFFDISNLDAPFLKYTYTGSTAAIDHNLYIKGPYVYQSNYTSGLRILDISNLDNSAPTEVAFFDNFPANDNKVMVGTWSVYPYFKSGNIILTNMNGAYGGFHIVTPNLPHYVLDVADETIPSICPGESATYTFNAKAYSGFNTFDNITITGLPAGATATIPTNPINPNGFFMMTVNTTASVAPGNYSLTLTGTQAPVNRVRVGMKVISSNPVLPPTQLASPAYNAVDQPVNNLTFNWNTVSGAVRYDLEISTNDNFATIDFAAYNLTGTTHTQSGLEYDSKYYWRVKAKNSSCGISNGFTPFLFKTLTDPLPVELVSFTATARNESILLEWQTASEDGFAGFELQRATSRNGNDFKKIAWYEVSNGNSNAVKNYSHLDADVLSGQTYYYRLNQIDLDGSAEFSPVVSATLSGKDDGLQLFPNPAANDISISYKQALVNQEVTLKIFDSTGRQVLLQTIDATELSTNGHLINIDFLAKGAYLVSLEDEGVKATARFVKR